MQIHCVPLLKISNVNILKTKWRILLCWLFLEPVHYSICPWQIAHVPPAEIALPRLTDISAAETFIDSAEVVIVGFFEVRDCVYVCLSEALVLLIVREEVKKGKRDQRRHLGMQTDEEKIRSLWQSFILSAITLMWNLGRRKCLCVVIPECWAFWPNSPGGGGNKNGTETLWDWLRLVSINKHSNNLTWT